jgi:DNA-binding transcriptional LysR family regulator
MKLDDLRAFVAFVDHGSVSRAARQLHLSQPALTRRIQRLESSMGGKLLDRSAKPPRVSPFGSRVCERARAVLREAAGLRELAAGNGEPRGSLRIGAVQSVSDAISLEALKTLKQRFPQLRLEMRSDSSAELTRKVELGQLDAAAVLLAPGASPAPSVVGVRIGAQRVNIVAGKGYDIGRSATLTELAAHPWVLYAGSCVCRAALQRALEAHGLQLQIALSEHGLEHQLALVSAGAGLGCATDTMLRISRHRRGLRSIRVKGLDIRFDIWLVHAPHPGALAAPIGCFEQVVARCFAPRPGA